MAEISRNKPSDVAIFVAPKDHKGADLCSLNDCEPTFRDVVRQANKIEKKPQVKKQTESNPHIPRKADTRNYEKEQRTSLQTSTVKSVAINKKESPAVKENEIAPAEIEDPQDSQKMEIVDLQIVEIDPQNKQIIEPISIVKNDNFTDEVDLSDLSLLDGGEMGDYTVDHYTAGVTETEKAEENNLTVDINKKKETIETEQVEENNFTVEVRHDKDIDAEETVETVLQDKSDVIIFANELQIASPKPAEEILNTNESVINNEFHNQTTRLDVQPVQHGVSRQNMHESAEHHVVATNPDNAQPEIELTAEEQKAVDAFVRATENFDNTKSESGMHVVHTNKNIPPAEMKRLLVVPMQLLETSQNEISTQASSDSDTHQVDPLSSNGKTGADKDNQGSMNFSQFSGSSSDMKNMAENSKIATHNLVSTNPAAEFIETLKQNFKQFGKIQTSKLTVQMRHSGKNLTIHFNADSDQVMNVTFRTTDKDWKSMLQHHAQQIEDVFENSNHTVNIKYLGE